MVRDLETAREGLFLYADDVSIRPFLGAEATLAELGV